MADIGVDIPIGFSGINDTLKDLKKLQSQGNDAVDSIAGAFRGLGGVIATALAGISLREIVHQAEESVEAVEKLEVTFRSLGEEASGTSELFEEFASSIQRTANISDEAVLNLVSLGKAMGFTNTETESLLNGAVDLAKVLGTSVDDAFNQLARTMNGQVSRSLAQRFPELKQLSIESLASGEAVRILGQRFQGTAAELNKSFSANRQGATIAFGEILEGIGKIIVQNPRFISAMGAAKDALFDVADTISKNVSSAIDATNRAIDALLPTLNLLVEEGPRIARLVVELLAIKQVIKVYSDLDGAIGKAITSFLIQRQVFGANIFQAAIVGLQSLAKSFNLVSIATKGATLAVSIFKAGLTIGLTIALDAVLSSAIQLREEFGSWGNVAVFLRNKFFNVILSGIEFLTDGIGSLLEAASKIPGSASFLGDAANSFRTLSERIRNSMESNNKEIDSLRKNQEDAGAGVKRSLDEQTKAYSKFTDNFTSASKARIQALQEEIKQQQLAVREAQRTVVQNASQNPVGFLFNKEDQLQKVRQTKGASESDVKLAETNAVFGQALGTLQQVLTGPQGATTLFSNIAGTIADSIIPGIGGVVGQITSVLAQGPEAAAGFVRGFLDSIPTIIENIASSIGPIIEAFIEKIPEILPRLAEVLSRAAVQFGISLAEQSPFIATRFTLELIKRIPEIISSMAKGAFDGFKEAFSSFGGVLGGGSGGGGILGGIGDIFGGAIGGIGDIFGFAEGGTIKGAAPYRDRIPSLVRPGENIVDHTTNEKLNRFLDSASGAAASVMGFDTQTIIVQVGEEEFARVQRRVQRNGYRTV